MNQQQALEVLINAVRIAQKRGAFELEEAPILAQAVEVFTPKQTETPKETDGSTEGDGETLTAE